VRLKLSVELDPSGLAVSDLRSSLHAVSESSMSTKGARWIQIQPGERLDRDFILRFRVGAEAMSSSLSLLPDGNGSQEGTFLLTLMPPVSSSPGKPREVIFVLDRSGSMDGWKMIAARRAVARMVDTLVEHDRFNVYAFDDQIESPPSFRGTDLVPATDRNRFRAIEFLAQVDHRGGTEMAEPLETAASALAGGYDDRDRILVLVTDGQIGNEDQILRSLGARLKNVRVVALGIDQAVNSAVLNRLAALGGGMAELVESEDRLDDVMARMHRRISSPLLTELAIESDGLAIDRDSTAPHRIPDFFEGTPLIVTGRYRGEARGAIRVTGRQVQGSTYDQRIEGRPTQSGALSSIWARAHIRDLEDRLVTSRSAEIEPKIVATSIRFSVLSRFTAFVAVDRSEVVNAGGHNHRVLQPVEAPEGWGMLGRGGPVPASAPVGGAARTRSAGPSSMSAKAPAPAQSYSSARAEPLFDDAVDREYASEQAEAPEVASRSQGVLRRLLAPRPASPPREVQKQEKAKKDSGSSVLERRAEAMLRTLGSLDDLRTLGADSTARALARLLVDLKALRDELALESRGDGWAEVLSELIEKLEAQERHHAHDVFALAEEATRVLGSFASGATPPPKPGRGASFWRP
jgi:Ca-activated chloride channel family protein